MRVYFFKAFAVVVGAPRQEWEGEWPTEYYENEERAHRMLSWWQFDQGRKDTEIVETWIECAMVDGVVIVPDNIKRGQ